MTVYSVTLNHLVAPQNLLKHIFCFRQMKWKWLGSYRRKSASLASILQKIQLCEHVSEFYCKSQFGFLKNKKKQKCKPWQLWLTACCMYMHLYFCGIALWKRIVMFLSALGTSPNCNLNVEPPSQAQLSSDPSPWPLVFGMAVLASPGWERWRKC